MKPLQNKTILITGGSRGIGAAVVGAAMARGASVAFTYHHSTETAESLTQAMTAQYPDQHCLALACDVADLAAMQQVIKGVIEQFGRVDALVNNAGITRDTALARMSRQQWDEVITTNLGSMYNAIQPLLLQLVKQRAGAIVNLSSAVAIYGTRGQANYAAAKGGIIGFTKALSAEVAPFGVRVNAVAPGYVLTEALKARIEAGQRDPSVMEAQSTLGRIVTPEDIAEGIRFLVSDAARAITGITLPIDCGWLSGITYNTYSGLKRN